MTEVITDRLRRGGYILYVKHGEANVGEDQLNLKFNYCCTQRNLSEIGRRQAICYGQVIRNLRIPICDLIVTSPLCRTIETALLAFEATGIFVDPFLYHIARLSGNIPEEEQQSILDSLQLRLEIMPPQGCNQVMIAHSFPEGIGLGEIPDMGTVVIKPDGITKGYEIIATMSLDEMLGLIN